MKKSDLRETIVAYLRAVGNPIASRALASRFLLLRHDNESTCNRLLAPLLADHPSLEYVPGQGWSYRRGGAGAPATAGLSTPSHPSRKHDSPTTSLRDFVALAAEGAGPSGSGRIRAVSLLPMVAGEECSPEHIPAWAAEGVSPPPQTVPIPGGGRSAGPAPVEGLSTVDLQILMETVGDLPIVCHRVAREASPLLQACAAAALPCQPITISLAKLGHVLLGLKPRHAPAELAAALGLEMREPDDCRDRVRLVTHCFLALLPMLEEIGITTFEDLQAFQNRPAAPLDFSPYAFTADDLKAVPARPGVYCFCDLSGETLYIGKAKNLRSRLSSYFVPSARGTARGRTFLDRVHSFTFEIVASELEALLKEAALLSELRPLLNRQFDVHQRPAPYGPRLNLAVVLPDDTATEGAPPEACTVHLMRRGRYQRRVRGIRPRRDGASDPRSQWDLLDDAIRAIYFQSRGNDDSTREADASDVDWQLMASYLARYRDEVNVLDVDECESSETALARLMILAEATVGGERVVAR